MSYLIAAVVLVGLLGLANLLLLIGVIRRLRMTQDASQLPPEGLQPGETIPDFTATATDGEPVSAAYLRGNALIGFLSPGCGPCRELLPEFVKEAGRSSGPVLAVVVATPQDDPAMDIKRLEKVARVVTEAPHGPVQQVFKVSGYPTVLTTDATGTVVFSDAALPHQVHA
ncbi:redoxin domain-containing protein [Nonomuraea mesophila]|uniref:Redoxin domain-containing protein n=1 Tax=Nonomuraea mesophila TaxID=2530382 RepID=A0A4R5E881_9ACTN|nr:redoxin family protein [Nonomuraea mesophila]TDE27161.1 redoxin domain-containing protein [Nonomuraea mesophila]